MTRRRNLGWRSRGGKINVSVRSRNPTGIIILGVGAVISMIGEPRIKRESSMVYETSIAQGFTDMNIPNLNLVSPSSSNFPVNFCCASRFPKLSVNKIKIH